MVYSGIEIHQDVIDHSREAIASWKTHFSPARDIAHIDIIRGNALEIDLEKGESALGFDRIYIGAAIGRQSLPHFKKLLKPGGILVGPGKQESTRHVLGIQNQTKKYLFFIFSGRRTGKDHT
jgi:protein-L-isoaspartate O-methyltransferase